MNIDSYLDEFKETFFPDNFEWRVGQREAIVAIIQAYEANTKLVILDAPVGSGKSIIGMAVAWILNQNKRKGFILASDIALQEQYEKDFKKANIAWGSVKGIDNYICSDNMERHSLGTCKIRNKAAKQMYCYVDCPYYTARDTAAESPTALLNYAYWLIHMNYVNVGMDDPPFPPRDFIVCDEAHKILDIIQSHYSPKFDVKTLEKLEKLTDFFKLYRLGDHTRDFIDIRDYIKELYKIEDNEQLHDLIGGIRDVLQYAYRKTWEKFKDEVKKQYPRDDPPKEWKEALRLCDWVKDLHCKLDDYHTMINKTSTDYIVKNPSSDNKELTFNCIEESWMMERYFHQWTGFTVLMSATFGDPSKYLKSIAAKSAKYIKMDSQFDFTESPIYFYNKRKMSYKQIEGNLPWMFAKVDEILDNHPNDNGIIHTASYDLALKIHNGMSRKHRSRVLVYNGTEEKRGQLEELKMGKNKILMGPSLLEGLDLKDSWSRFQIFAKVPYLSLSDKFVARKLQINPDWYREKAILNILQGTGRSVRNEKDWAITYILDGALGDLIHSSRKSFPPEFMKRLIICE